jgi:hypothetical protein
MHYLYASKWGGNAKLVATFDSEEQLRSYVRWATLQNLGDGRGKFEQGSVLAAYDAWAPSAEPLQPEDATADVDHNPTPGML